MKGKQIHQLSMKKFSLFISLLGLSLVLISCSKKEEVKTVVTTKKIHTTTEEPYETNYPFFGKTYSISETKFSEGGLVSGINSNKFFLFESNKVISYQIIESHFSISKRDNYHTVLKFNYTWDKTSNKITLKELVNRSYSKNFTAIKDDDVLDKELNPTIKQLKSSKLNLTADFKSLLVKHSGKVKSYISK